MCQPFVITLFNSPWSCLVRAKANSSTFRLTTDSSQSLSFPSCFSKCCPVSSVYSLPQLHWMSSAQHRQHMFVACLLIRWRGLYSRHSILCACVLCYQTEAAFRPGQAVWGQPVAPACVLWGWPRRPQLRSTIWVTMSAMSWSHCNKYSYPNNATSQLRRLHGEGHFCPSFTIYQSSSSDLLLQEFILRSNHQISPKKLDDLHPAALHFWQWQEKSKYLNCTVYYPISKISVKIYLFKHIKF